MLATGDGAAYVAPGAIVLEALGDDRSAVGQQRLQEGRLVEEDEPPLAESTSTETVASSLGDVPS